MTHLTETKIELIGQLIVGGTYRCDVKGADGSQFANWFRFDGDEFTVIERPQPRHFYEGVNKRWQDVVRTGVIIKITEGVNIGRTQALPVVCLGISDTDDLAKPRDDQFLDNETYLLS